MAMAMATTTAANPSPVEYTRRKEKFFASLEKVESIFNLLLSNYQTLSPERKLITSTLELVKKAKEELSADKLENISAQVNMIEQIVAAFQINRMQKAVTTTPQTSATTSSSTVMPITPPTTAAAVGASLTTALSAGAPASAAAAAAANVGSSPAPSPSSSNSAPQHKM